jgi:hypothetical protein
MSDKKTFKYMYSLIKRVLDDETVKFEVVGKDGFKWGNSSSPKGALFDALAVGINLSDIEINMYVPDFGDVIVRANG